MEESSLDNKPQLKVEDSVRIQFQSFKEEENTSNISDIVVLGNDSGIENKKNHRRQAAVRINDNDDIECLPGYRFNPFDHELLVHYLWKKVKKQPLPHNKIREVELYKYNPEDITRMHDFSFLFFCWFFVLVIGHFVIAIFYVCCDCMCFTLILVILIFV